MNSFKKMDFRFHIALTTLSGFLVGCVQQSIIATLQS